MQYLEPNDLAKLFRVMYDTNRNHWLVALTQFFTGARIEQVLSLKGEDIFEVNGRMVIKIHARKRGNDGFKTIHLDADPTFDMSPLLALAKTRPNAVLFGGLSRQYFNQVLKKYCAAAGIHSDFGHSHVFRHSAAMVIWNATTKLGTISHFLQHASPATACFYLAEADGKAAQEAMDNLQFAAA
jgi:integrase